VVRHQQKHVLVLVLSAFANVSTAK